MQENEQPEDESEVASMKKDINDALGANYYDSMQALDGRFAEIGLGTPVQENYALMQDAIVMPQKEIWDSNDLVEYTEDDYEEVTKEFYEELLDEETGIDLRGRAVIDFVINRLKDILESFTFQSYKSPREARKT